MGGEKFGYFGVMHFEEGSPPHGRGKEQRQLRFVDRVGIIPAWAGKSKNCSGHCSAPPDHPRVGGEKTENITPSIYEQGSPPHRRGKDHGVAVAEGVEGITPAHAGKSIGLGSP